MARTHLNAPTYQRDLETVCLNEIMDALQLDIDDTAGEVERKMRLALREFLAAMEGAKK